MTRPHGTLEWIAPTCGEPGHYKARIRLSTGARPWVHLHWSIRTEAEARAHVAVLAACGREGFVAARVPRPGATDVWMVELQLEDGELVKLFIDADDLDAAVARGREIASRIRERRFTVADLLCEHVDGETCSEWWQRHLRRRTESGQATVDDARGRYRNWIEPFIGAVSIKSVTREDLEPIVDVLDDAMRDGRIEWRTARNIWGEVTSAFRQACSSKVRSLRVRPDNPTVNMQGPDRGVDKEKPILFPSEVVALLSCEAVPLHRRRAYALAIYTATRANELAALTATVIDLEHARMSVVQQRDPTSDGNRTPKTRRARSFDLEPALMPLVRLLVEERRHGRLLDPVDEDRAALLRADLRTAGITREALFVRPDDPVRAPITFHRLRDTGLTWMAVRGDDPLRIQWRGGHTDFRTTQGYIVAARNLGPAFGVPFPRLPACILAPVADAERADDQRYAQHGG